MKTRSFRLGLTLLELLVVLGILALLAALVVPKLVDIYDRSRSATQAYSLNDSSRMIETFYGLNHKYPDGWDTLMATGGSQYSKLSPTIESPRTYFTTATLTPDQITSLSSAGIGHVFLHDESAADPSSSGVDRRHLGTGAGHDGTANINQVLAISTASGSDGLNLLINNFGLNPNRSSTDTTLPRISLNTYVVLGLGPKSTIVQGTVQSAPFFDHPASSTTYSRAICVFEVPNTGTVKAKLVGVFGPDGRAVKESLSDYNTGVVPH